MAAKLIMYNLASKYNSWLENVFKEEKNAISKAEKIVYRIRKKINKEKTSGMIKESTTKVLRLAMVEAEKTIERAVDLSAIRNKAPALEKDGFEDKNNRDVAKNATDRAKGNPFTAQARMCKFHNLYETLVQAIAPKEFISFIDPVIVALEKYLFSYYKGNPLQPQDSSFQDSQKVKIDKIKEELKNLGELLSSLSGNHQQRGNSGFRKAVAHFKRYFSFFGLLTIVDPGALFLRSTPVSLYLKYPQFTNPILQPVNFMLFIAFFIVIVGILIIGLSFLTLRILFPVSWNLRRLRNRSPQIRKAAAEFLINHLSDIPQKHPARNILLEASGLRNKGYDYEINYIPSHKEIDIPGHTEECCYRDDYAGATANFWIEPTWKTIAESWLIAEVVKRKDFPLKRSNGLNLSILPCIEPFFVISAISSLAYVYQSLAKSIIVSTAGILAIAIGSIIVVKRLKRDRSLVFNDALFKQLSKDLNISQKSILQGVLRKVAVPIKDKQERISLLFDVFNQEKVSEINWHSKLLYESLPNAQAPPLISAKKQNDTIILEIKCELTDIIKNNTDEAEALLRRWIKDGRLKVSLQDEKGGSTAISENDIRKIAFSGVRFEITLPGKYQSVNISYTTTDNRLLGPGKVAIVGESENTLESFVAKLKLALSDVTHIKGLLRKFHAPKVVLEIGKTFLPSGLLNKEKREKELGAKDYREIVAEPDNTGSAKNITVIFNPMDGGLGSNVKRTSYLNQRSKSEPEVASRPHDKKKPEDIALGAKGTDLAFTIELSGKQFMVSIAEIKLLHVINIAKQFKNVFFQPLVSSESAPSYNALLNKEFLLDRADQSRSVKRTYRQVMAEYGLQLVLGEEEMLYQANLPVIDLENDNTLTDRYTAPGGHAQWGVRLLEEAKKIKLPEGKEAYIRAFYNGDGIANFPDAAILGWMASSSLASIVAHPTSAPSTCPATAAKSRTAITEKTCFGPLG